LYTTCRQIPNPHVKDKICAFLTVKFRVTIKKTNVTSRNLKVCVYRTGVE